MLLPVEFKTYPDDEPGPYKPHLRNLDTRQNEDGFYGEFEKCVAVGQTNSEEGCRLPDLALLGPWYEPLPFPRSCTQER